jgi:hypothetical protein
MVLRPIRIKTFNGMGGETTAAAGRRFSDQHGDPPSLPGLDLAQGESAVPWH